MADRSEVAHLKKALRQAGCTPIQQAMAAILAGVNDIECALEFIHQVQAAGLTKNAIPPQQAELWGIEIAPPQQNRHGGNHE